MKTSVKLCTYNLENCWWSTMLFWVFRMECYLGSSLIPRPTCRTWKRARWHLPKSPYVLSQQSWFWVAKLRSSIVNYYTVVKFFKALKSVATCCSRLPRLASGCCLARTSQLAECHQALFRVLCVGLGMRLPWQREWVGGTDPIPLLKTMNLICEPLKRHSLKHVCSFASPQILDATRKGNLSRFINHSCDPNCETQKVWPLNFWFHNAWLSVALMLSSSNLPAVYLFVCLSTCSFVCLSVCLSTCPSVCLSVCLSICLSVHLSICLLNLMCVCSGQWMGDFALASSLWERFKLARNLRLTTSSRDLGEYILQCSIQFHNKHQRTPTHPLLESSCLLVIHFTHIQYTLTCIRTHSHTHSLTHTLIHTHTHNTPSAHTHTHIKHTHTLLNTIPTLTPTQGHCSEVLLWQCKLPWLPRSDQAISGESRRRSTWDGVSLNTRGEEAGKAEGTKCGGLHGNWLHVHTNTQLTAHGCVVCV